MHGTVRIVSRCFGHCAFGDDCGFGLTRSICPPPRPGIDFSRRLLFPVSRLTTPRAARHHCYCIVSCLFFTFLAQSQSAHTPASRRAPHQLHCTNTSAQPGSKGSGCCRLQLSCQLHNCSLHTIFPPTRCCMGCAYNLQLPISAPQSYLFILHSTLLIDHT